MSDIVGMMWQWNRAEGLEQAVKEAVAHYARTRGHEPRACYANPRDFATVADGRAVLVVTDVPVRPRKGIPPSHLWLTREEIDACSQGPVRTGVP